jgi:hypothetical protein
MGDGRIFLKSSALLSVSKTIRMNILSARSISLDSTGLNACPNPSPLLFQGQRGARGEGGWKPKIRVPLLKSYWAVLLILTLNPARGGLNCPQFLVVKQLQEKSQQVLWKWNHQIFLKFFLCWSYFCFYCTTSRNKAWSRKVSSLSLYHILLLV